MNFTKKLLSNEEISNIDKETKNTFIDTRDGHIYKTVKIGNQTLLAENFAYKADGGCWAYSNNSSNVSKYGYLYNCETAKKVIPAGWHLPTKEEWEILYNFLGGDNEKVFNAIKLGGSSGFNALLGGNRSTFGEFYNIEVSSYFWSATESGESQAWALYFDAGSSNADLYDDDRKCGFSVRLFRD